MTPPPRILLSFSSTYKSLATQLGNDLKSAHVDVQYDQWEGGGAAPGTRRIGGDVAGMAGVVVLMTPSGSASTWMGEEWKQAVFERAATLGVPVLPVN